MINYRQEMLPYMASSLGPRYCRHRLKYHKLIPNRLLRIHIEVTICPSFLSYADSSPRAPIQPPCLPQRLKPRVSSMRTLLVRFCHILAIFRRSEYADRRTAVFSKSWCPYCKASKQLLSELGAKAYILELDEVGRLPCDSIRAELFKGVMADVRP